MIFPAPARERGGRSVSLVWLGSLALQSQLKWRPDRLPWLPRNALNYRVEPRQEQVRGSGIGVLLSALPCTRGIHGSSDESTWGLWTECRCRVQRGTFGMFR